MISSQPKPFSGYLELISTHYRYDRSSRIRLEWKKNEPLCILASCYARLCYSPAQKGDNALCSDDAVERKSGGQGVLEALYPYDSQPFSLVKIRVQYVSNLCMTCANTPQSIVNHRGYCFEVNTSGSELYYRAKNGCSAETRNGRSTAVLTLTPCTPVKTQKPTAKPYKKRISQTQKS